MLHPVFLVNSVGVAFGCVRMLTGAFSVIYLLSKGVSVAEIGWIKAFQGGVLVFVDIPLSHFSDKYSRKFSICLSILFASLWLALTGWGVDFIDFLVAEFFNALSLGLMSGTFGAYLYDVSRKQNENELAVHIFSRYQKHHFLFMSFFSLLGVSIYHWGSEQVWIIAACMMMVVFLFSLLLPGDEDNQHGHMNSLLSTLKTVVFCFFGKSVVAKKWLFTNLLLALIMQILIQFWQVFVMPYNSLFDNEVIFGVAFFLILLSQSVAGLLVERIHSQNIIWGMMTLSLSASILSLLFITSWWYFSIISLCLLFLATSSATSISLARLVESCPQSMRSTVLSSSAVFSKILMFVFMPLTAYSINGIGLGYLVVIAVIVFGVVMTFRYSSRQ